MTTEPFNKLALISNQLSMSLMRVSKHWHTCRLNEVLPEVKNAKFRGILHFTFKNE